MLVAAAIQQATQQIFARARAYRARTRESVRVIVPSQLSQPLVPVKLGHNFDNN